MKRVTAIIMGFLAVLLIGVHVSAQPVVLRIPDRMAKYYETVEFPVYIDGTVDLESIELVVEYEGIVLEWDELLPGSQTAGFTREAASSWGRVEITMTSPTPVTVSGEIAVLRFDVWCDIGEPIDIAIKEVSINNGAIAYEVENGLFEVAVGVTGNIRYFTGNKPIGGVNLSFDGAELHQFKTDASGEIDVVIPSGHYTVSASKDDGLDGVTAYDASLIMRAISGDITLNSFQNIAADVNRNEKVDEDDVVRLLEHVVGLSDDFPGTGNPWIFFPDWGARTFNFDVDNMELTGILLGEVSGNWGQESPTETQAVFSVGDVSAQSGSEVIIPVNVDTKGTDLYAAELLIAYDSNKMELRSPYITHVPEQARALVNAGKAGEARIAWASTEPIRGSGSLLELKAQLLGDFEGIVPLQLVNARFNEAPAGNLRDGSVVVSPHASVMMSADRIAAATLVKGAPQVFWDAAYLSRSHHGETGLYMAFPGAIGNEPGQLSPDVRIVSAMLLWKLASPMGEGGVAMEKEIGITLHPVIDPDDLGAPALSDQSGQKTGLSYIRRDDRVGMEIPWTESSTGGIEDALQMSDFDVYIRMNPAVVNDRWAVVEIKDIVEAWLDGDQTSPDQGIFLRIHDGWEPGDRLDFEDLKLLVYYTTSTATPPASVDLSEINPTGGTVSLQWNGTGPGVQGVRVTRAHEVPLVSPYDPNAEVMGSVAAPSFQYDDDGVEDGEVYYYGLVAVDGEDNYGPIVVRRVIPGTLLPPDVQLTGGQDTLTLSWSAVSGAEGYAVYRRGEGERVFTRQHEGVIEALQWQDRSLHVGRNYEYFVVTVNNEGEGPPSEIHEGTIVGPQMPPAMPSDLIGTERSPHSVHLAWKDNSDNELVFEILRDGGVEPIAVVSANTTELVVEGLEPGQSYQFHVRARNDGGVSGVVSTQVSTSDGPAMPKNVRWRQVSPGSIDVEWDAPGTGVAIVTVVLYGGDDQEIERVNLVPGIHSIRFNRLVAGEEYAVEVTFRNLAGESGTRLDYIVTTDYFIKGPGM